jgi:hypothetical protein
MSDSAFKTAPYSGYSTPQLREFVAKIDDMNNPTLEVQNRRSVMFAEIERRERVEAGDVSVMTDGERLRRVRTAKAAKRVTVAGIFANPKGWMK